MMTFMMMITWTSKINSIMTLSVILYINGSNSMIIGYDYSKVLLSNIVIIKDIPTFQSDFSEDMLINI